MKILHYIYIFVLLSGFLLTIIACNSPIEKPATSVPPVSLSPSSPIKVVLSISKLPLLNEPVEITCNVTSRSNAPNSTTKIKLSKGSSLISGDLQWQGDLVANTPVAFSAQIVFQELGHHTIEAGASCIIDDKNSWGDLDAIYLDIGRENSTFGWPVTPPKLVRTDKWGAIKTDVEISHAPKLNKPAKLFITIVSPVDFPGLSLGILISPKSVVLSDSDSKLTAVTLVPGANQVAMQVAGVDLQANVPYHFSATVVFKDTGYYHVTADAQQKVDNSIHHGTQDTIYLKIGAKESTFEQEPSEEPTSGTIPPPPPAIRP